MSYAKLRGRMVNGSSGPDAKEDGLSASLRELAKELESD